MQLFLASACLFIAPLSAQEIPTVFNKPVGISFTEESLQILRENHLDTPEGRQTLLLTKLAPLSQEAEILNGQITSLSQQIEKLSPVTDQKKILEMTEEMTQKMEKLTKFMEVLLPALHLEEDLAQIETLLTQTDSLTKEQLAILERVTKVCKFNP